MILTSKLSSSSKLPGESRIIPMCDVSGFRTHGAPDGTRHTCGPDRDRKRALDHGGQTGNDGSIALIV